MQCARPTQRSTSSIDLWRSNTRQMKRSTSRARTEVSFVMSKPHRTHHRSRFETTLDDQEQRVDTSSTTRISIAFTASTFTVC
ncbi:hypothetical protein BTO02_18130 [Paraburkholderia sp. SOS3]|nr:hypothetical protein BTO02_18130 [Paraburkholderia sp. SOS3]